VSQYSTEVRRHSVCDVCEGTEEREGIYLRIWLDRRGTERRRVILIRDGAGLDLRSTQWRPLDFWLGLPGRWLWLGELNV